MLMWLWSNYEIFRVKNTFTKGPAHILGRLEEQDRFLLKIMTVLEFLCLFSWVGSFVLRMEA